MPRRNIKMNLNVENVIIVILLIVLIVLAILYLTDNKEKFSAVNSDAPTFIFYYVDWCGYCKRTKPLVEDLIKKNEAENMGFRIIKNNCEGSDEERQRAKSAGVRGYPTIFINGVEFEGPRSVDAWVEALNSGN